MNKEKLTEIYMSIYTNFAVETVEIVEQFSLDRKEAIKALNYLESKGLICGEFHDGNGTFGLNRKDVPGINKMWQCWNTYDSESEERALARIKGAI